MLMITVMMLEKGIILDSVKREKGSLTAVSPCSDRRLNGNRRIYDDS